MLIDPERIAPAPREILQNRDIEIWVSSISILELAIKASIGKFDLQPNLLEEIGLATIGVLTYSAGDALGVKTLPLHHRDPFDRALLAQARHRGLTFVTSDETMLMYRDAVSMLWAGRPPGS